MNVDNSYESPPAGAMPSNMYQVDDMNAMATKALDQITISSVLVTLLVSLILYDQG